jgi:hypothetical protein
MRAFRETIAESSGRMSTKFAALEELLMEDPLSTAKHSIVITLEPQAGLSLTQVLSYVIVIELFMVLIALGSMTSEKV